MVRRTVYKYADVDPATRQQLVEPLIRADRPAASTYPVFGAIEIGRDGRIWVRTSRPPPPRPQQEWLIFSAEGELQCRVELEPFEQLPDFGADYILVMRRDEFGVERIQLHDLGAPRGASE